MTKLSKAQQELLDEPSDIKLYGGCLGGGKSWQGSQDLSTVFPPPLEIEWIILDEATDYGDFTLASGLMAKIKEAQRLRPHTFADIIVSYDESWVEAGSND